MKRLNQNIFKEILCFIILIVLAGFFLFWKIDKVPPDLDGEIADIGQATYLLGQARLNNIPYSELIQRSGQGAPMARNIYGVPVYLFYLQISGRTLPLWTSILYPFLYLFGSTKFALVLASSIIGIITIISTYFIAKAVYDRRIAFLAATFFSFSLYFLINIRCGWGFHTITAFVVLLNIYLLYLFLIKKQWKFLWLFGIVWGIGWFNGHPLYLFIPIILVLSLAWIGKDFKFWQKREFWLPAITAFSVCFGLSVIYSLLFNLDSPFQAFYSLNRHWLFTRGAGESAFSRGLIFFLSNPINAIQNLFIGMTYMKASSPIVIVPRRPMIDPFISIFFLRGLFLSLRERKIIDKLLLLWVGTAFIVFACLTVFQVRYMIVIAPAIYIIAAKAMVDSIKVAKKKDADLKKHFKKNQILITILIIFGVVFSASFTYCNYFKIYAKNDAYLWRFVGNRKIVDHIRGKAEPEECQVVFGHLVLVPAENFIFYTQEKYPIMRWDNISKEKNIIQIQDWERDVFTQGKRIVFYVFSLDNKEAKTPGKRSWGDYEDITLFKRLHPQLEPAKTIYYTCGLPAFAIYEVSEPPRIKYDYHLGSPGQSMRTQTFFLGHPILDKIKFQISYVGKKASLPSLIMELRKTKGELPVPDMTSTGLLASIRISPAKLNLKKGKYSTLSLPYSKLDPEATYAIVWKQERIDSKNHYLLAGQPSDIYEKGQFGYYDGSQWIMSDTDANFIPLPADYTIESTVSKGIHAFRIPEGLTSGKMNFKIIFRDKEWQREIFDQKNLRYEESNNGQFRWLTPEDESGGYLVYKIESPRLIKSIELITNPRIHNDWEKKNFLRFSYSLDGKKYYQIYKLDSNGNENWTGIYEREMYNTIHPKSKVIYLRFDFNQGNTQLWATKEHPIIFNTEVSRD